MMNRLHQLTRIGLAACILGMSGFSLVVVQSLTRGSLFFRYLEIMDARDAIVFALVAEAECGNVKLDTEEENSLADLSMLAELKDVRLLQIIDNRSLERPPLQKICALVTAIGSPPSLKARPEEPPPKDPKLIVV